jgi:hypothetical protein
MDAILIHIGCTGPYISGFEPPAHMEYCIKQYRTFNDADLYILTDRANIPHLQRYVQEYDRIIPIAIEDYSSDKILRFNALYNYGAKEYWNVVVTRLMYLENFLRERDMRYVCHFENDVLLYFNIEQYAHVFRQLYKGLAVTPLTARHSTTGFMYIDNYKALEHMTDFFIETLTEFGIAGTIERCKDNMVNEMVLMKLYYDVKSEGRMEHLPILPFGEHSENLDRFGGIFDSVSYGQSISGAREGGPPMKLQGHYVGALLLAHPEYKIDWKVENGLRLPYLNCDGNLVKMNSLHIHSKNMRPCMSRE